MGGSFLSARVQPQIRTICGPRAAVLEINAAMLTVELYKKLSVDDSLNLAQFVPWDARQVSVFTRGRWVRCEAIWPDNLVESIVYLRDLPALPHDRVGRWTVGINEHGGRVTASLRDSSPHVLVAGTTGSGKSMAMQVATLGLSETCQLALIDGKRGESLLPCQHLPNIIGPVATDLDTARDALGWVVGEMNRRYDLIANGEKLKFKGTEEHGLSRLVVIFDEFQAYTTDPIISDLLATITSQGRAAGVHVIMATHHPVVDMFGDAVTKRELVMRYALKVTDFEASRVALGVAAPRADRLAMNGDSWLLASSSVVHRVQGAYIDEHDLAKVSTFNPQMDEWPEFVAEDVGQERHTRFEAARPEEIALAIRAAKLGVGRPTLAGMFTEADIPVPGANRLRRIMKLGSDIWGQIYDICDNDNDDYDDYEDAA